MTLTYQIDLSRSTEGEIGVRVDVVSDASSVTLRLTAQAVDNGVRCDNLHALTAAGDTLPLTVEGDTLIIPAGTFSLRYTLVTEYDACVGSDRHYAIDYPFANANEVFFGTGALACPPDAQTPTDFRAALTLEGLPTGFIVFSSLMLNGLSATLTAGKLGEFFVYAARDRDVKTHHVRLQSGAAFVLHLLVGHDKRLPVAEGELFSFIDDYLRFLEARIAPYRQLEEVNYLVLQAAPDFEARTHQRAFATGANVANGIMAFAPDDPAYLMQRFGHDDYRYFLFDGIAHELLHFYTTSTTDPDKSVLFAAPDCPRHDRWLLGEVLNAYFHTQYMMKFFKGSLDLFLTETISAALNRWSRNRQRAYLLDWFVFDLQLRYYHKVSLLELFRTMVIQKQRERTPYPSLEWVFEVLRGMGIALTEKQAALLQESAIPNYTSLVDRVLRLIGYEITESDDTLRVTKSPHDVPQLRFDL